jgi:putative heme-binding domain-containing protein
MSKSTFLFSFVTFISVALQAQVPEWIWHPNDGAKPADHEVRYFRKTFSLEQRPKKAVLTATGDDAVDVWINGEKVLSVSDWKEAKNADVTKNLVSGENVIALLGTNGTGDAAVLARLEIDIAKRTKDFVVTDKSWLTATTKETNWQTKNFSPGTNWINAKSFGKHGVEPWGEVMKKITATAAEDLKLLPGFKAELLWTSQAGEGSWICMTTDDKGRLIISPQDDAQQLWRVTLSRSGKITKKEMIPAPVHQAMGLLYAHDSLYVNGHGPSGTGLYRLVDKNKNDRFDTNEFTFLKKIPGEGEHGYHALVLGPDKMIYMINGNHTKLPEGISPTSPHRNYKEDLLLPRQWDANGHAVGILAPGGHILRFDKDGKNWELMLGGFRNTYDFDFSPDGEIFGFDSDMEWDWGLPWYRPTRIIHAIPGGEYGWRSGSGKWPAYYPDSLPAVVNIGVGSPTGVKFGTKSKFPEKYRSALFGLDWSYGRIFAVHLEPKGATYDGNFETFVKGKPLNVSDLEFGKDGAMYFITGGRATQSGLYRVTYVGKKIKEPKKSEGELANEKDAKQARELRHKLESFDGKKDPSAVDFAWPHLGSDDRWIRYAARIAIESQDVSQWKDRALKETDVKAGLTALLALARVGGKETQHDLLFALKNFPVASLDESQKLEKLRIIEVSFARQGKPDPEIGMFASDRLSRYYPASSELLNRELCQLLVYLEAPGVATKSLALMEKAKTQEDQLYYIFQLRNLKTGWTIDERKKYFTWLKLAQEQAKSTNEVAIKASAGELIPSREHPVQLIRWFEEADRKYADGVSYPKYLVNIRKDAIANCTTDERTALGELVADQKETVVAKPSKERKFVKEWKLADLESSLSKVGSGRNFEQGKTVFSDAQCQSCHRYGNEGGAVGPELTVVSSRFSRHDILDSILEPSKALSEQFQNFVITKKDGDDVVGRIVDETPDKIVVQPNPLVADRVEIKLSDIVKREPSKLSPMPEGLLNNFNEDEILDLLAYIESLGKPGAENFAKKDKAAHPKKKKNSK